MENSLIAFPCSHRARWCSTWKLWKKTQELTIYKKCPLIAVVLLCTQGKLVGLSCCLVSCAALNWASGVPAQTGNTSIIFLLYHCNHSWYYEWPFLNFFGIGWKLRGIRNIGHGKISWVLGHFHALAHTLTQTFSSVYLEQKAGNQCMTYTWKWCAGILRCIPLLYYQRDTPCWALTVLPRKNDAVCTLWKLRAESACVTPFQEVQNRAMAGGKLCPHFPVLFCPMANPRRSHRIVRFGRDFRDSSLLPLAVEWLSGGVIVKVSPEENKAEGGATQKSRAWERFHGSHLGVGRLWKKGLQQQQPSGSLEPVQDMALGALIQLSSESSHCMEMVAVTSCLVLARFWGNVWDGEQEGRWWWWWGLTLTFDCEDPFLFGHGFPNLGLIPNPFIWVQPLLPVGCCPAYGFR